MNRHCTSLSQLDGRDGGRVGDGRNTFENHLYGTFTSAKERVLQAGRLLCSEALVRNAPVWALERTPKVAPKES